MENSRVKMRFGDFVFPSNPAKLEISTSLHCSEGAAYGGGSRTKPVSLRPVTVRGKGEFYGDTAAQSCHHLQHMLRLQQPYELILPTAVGLEAYLSEFSFGKTAGRNSISYSFVFTEAKSTAVQTAQCCTVAARGENAFMTAGRCGVSVSDIMRLNDLKTPFDLKEGDRVVLR